MKSNHELPGVLLNQEICILLAIILIPGRVIGHEIVIKVVIAPHAHKKYALSNCPSYIICSKIISNLIKCVLKIPYLLIKRYATHLTKTIIYIKLANLMQYKCSVNWVMTKLVLDVGGISCE